MPPDPPDRRRLILHVFPGFAIGGAQMRFAQVANHWGDRWRHLIVAINGDLACRERLDPRLTVDYPPIDLAKSATLGNLRRIRAALRAWRPDVLVTSNWGAIEWALAWRTLRPPRPLHVHTEDGFGPEEADRQLPRRVWTRRLALRHSTVVLPSRLLLGIATDIWRLPPSGLRWIANGVDLDRFARQAPESGDLPVIGTVATLRPEKNLARLIEAFAIVAQTRPARLVVVGDGPQRAALQAQAAALGLADRIRFTGHLTATETEIARFDVFALSSDTEQMPLSILEAMAAGCPVAATDVGDVRHMLAPENLSCITERSAPALAAAIGVLLDDPPLRQRIGAANRAKAMRDYDQRSMLAAYANLFESGPIEDLRDVW